MSNENNISITDIEIIPLKELEFIGNIEPAWDKGGTLRFTRGGGSVTMVHTNQGITGIGPGPRQISDFQKDRIKEIIVGEDPFNVEHLYEKLKYYVFTTPYEGTSGVEIAIWDIIGKATNQPLYKLWGGAKNKVIPYASLIRLSTPEERAEQAGKLASEGWKAVKVRIHHEEMKDDIRTIELVRDAVGSNVEIMVDANQAQSFGRWQPGVRWDLRRALDTAKLLNQLNVYWLEEPLPRYAFDDLAKLNNSTPLRISGGENNRNVNEFKIMLEKNSYDVLQPECMVLDGMTDMLKIAKLATFYDKTVIPHHGGWDLGQIAHLHFVAAFEHSPFLELLNDPPIAHYSHHFATFENAPVVKDGWIDVPEGPGLGIEINPDYLP